jgi:hypothetical protein
MSSTLQEAFHRLIGEQEIAPTDPSLVHRLNWCSRCQRDAIDLIRSTIVAR